MVHVDRFGVVPKKHQPGKWHLITDLSFPEEESVNTPLIHPCAHLNTQIAKRAMSFGRGTLMAKIDINAAYRLIIVSPADQHYLGMCWKEKLYIDAKL